jgi:hypothetical protein
MFLSVRNQVSPHIDTYITGEVTPVCILSFTFLESKKGEEKTLGPIVAGILGVQSARTFFMNEILILTDGSSIGLSRFKNKFV